MEMVAVVMNSDATCSNFYIIIAYLMELYNQCSSKVGRKEEPSQQVSRELACSLEWRSKGKLTVINGSKISMQYERFKIG